VRVTDTAILDAEMKLEKRIEVPHGISTLSRGEVQAYLINHNADNPLATFRFQNPQLKMHAAEKEFEAGKMKFRAGTFLLKPEENPGDLKDQLEQAGAEHGFTAYAVSELPDVSLHAVSVPRVALMHTWMSTQTEGWVRIALDELEIPYAYISVHEVRDNPDLRSKWDVILFGPSTSSALSIVRGLSGDKPIPWQKSEFTPNCGIQDSTDDMRGGLDLEGVLHLKDFIEQGGLLITLTSSSSLPIHFGLAEGVTIKDTQELWARGGVYQGEVTDRTSPIAYGYDKELGVYFNSSPVFARGSFGGGRRYTRMGGADRDRISGRGGKKDPDIPQGRARDLGQETIKEFQKQQREERKKEERPEAKPRTSTPRMRTIIRFTNKEEELLISGGLAGASELAGAPAVVDCPLGEGHVVMFSINPMWRHQTHGSYFLVLNAMLHFDNLHVK